VVQIVVDRRRHAARTTGRHRDVAPGARVVEIACGHRDGRSAANDWRAALELLERHVDAGVAQRVQRPVESARGDQRSQIAKLAARVTKELQIRTRRMVVDRSFDDAEKIRFALLEALGDDGARPAEASEGGEGTREARERRAKDEDTQRVTHARASQTNIIRVGWLIRR
jgi:hypothetical protein